MNSIMNKIFFIMLFIHLPFICNSNELYKSIDEYFPNQKIIFGVKIIGTKSTPLKSIDKASIILNQWLDNDNNGKADNSLVIDALVKNNAILIMGNTENDLEKSFDDLIEAIEEKDIDIDKFEKSFIGLISNEPNISYLEEILHLISQIGYAHAYPEIFGEFKGSKIAEAMDIARGGYFQKTPKTYPEKAWYHYDDESCDYACMITEYFYWSLTSLLGAQSNRYDEISHEWELHTPDKMKKDELIVKLLLDPKYKIPKTLPDF